MTDITELAQSLKAAADKAGFEKWQVKRNGPGEYEVMVKGSLVKRNGWSTHRPVAEGVVDKKTADFIALANPANILALVEELEKAQGMEAYWKTQCRGITDHCEELQARIAELEESHAQVIQSRDHYKRMSEEGLKQLAESRTVTVKLPEFKMLEDYLAEVDVEERKAILLVVRMEFHRLLNDAGIKTEVA
ncbi:ead/Ea22-like family protein [Klebsiella aerogenes]|uniref:ead/Ea22-like family protein n=1 Tax=Klebsiella aerogenes TaxID=548 RepID=UPI0028A555E6|nr:ead/Ea22-like family protein [Klebsiella aerogenes]MDT4309826.1 ead/Ea22-like family protein [Klebsiella aerogenes]